MSSIKLNDKYGNAEGNVGKALCTNSIYVLLRCVS